MLDDLVAPDAVVRVVDAWIETLNLAKMGFSKTQAQRMGRPPYDPGDLLKLYVCGYLNGVRSSRALERECHRNVEVMWLLGRLAPDHKTIAEFRRQNSAALVAVSAAFVQPICNVRKKPSRRRSAAISLVWTVLIKTKMAKQ